MLPTLSTPALGGEYCILGFQQFSLSVLVLNLSMCLFHTLLVFSKFSRMSVDCSKFQAMGNRLSCLIGVLSGDT